jgi:hypothetical protein
MPSHGFIAPPPEEDQTRERQNQSPSDSHIPLDTCRAGQSETNLLAKRDRRQSERRWSEPVPAQELHPLEYSAFHGALLRQS